MPSVSVIIPVYMVERFIRRCAVSLFKSTLDDIEFVFVDDCSRDNSIQILHEIISCYPHRADYVKIIQMPYNSGQAEVRKVGLLNSTGEYVIHCDSDDWVDTDLYAKMYDSAKQYDADVVFCDEIIEYMNSSVCVSFNSIPSSGKELMLNWYKKAFGLHLHNKLVRRSIYIDNSIVPWPNLNMWEDNGLIARILYYSKIITHVSGSFYHYNRNNEAAITSRYGEKEVSQMIGIAENLSAFFDNLPDAHDFQKTKYAFQFLSKINLIGNSWQGLRRYHNIFPEANQITRELDPFAFSSKGRIRFYFVKYHMEALFILIYKLFSFIHFGYSK